MSLPLRPLSVPSRYRRKSLSVSDDPPSPQMSFSSALHTLSPPYSSPPSSSPPPQSPFSVSSHYYARIQSSPRLPFDVGFNIPDIDESMAFDARSSCSPSKAPRESITLPSFNASFPSDDELPFAFEYDASDSSDGFSVDDTHLSSRYKSNRNRFSYVVRTRHEWDDMGDPETDQLSDDSRGTFFSVSAERGRWKSDPLRMFPRMNLFTVTPATPYPRTNLGEAKAADRAECAMVSANAYVESAESSYPSPPMSIPSDLAVSPTSKMSPSASPDETRRCSRLRSPPPSLVTSLGAVEPSSPLSLQTFPDATSSVSPERLPSPSQNLSVSPMGVSLASFSEPVSPLSLTLGLPNDPDGVLAQVDEAVIEENMDESMDLESGDDYLPDVSDDIRMVSWARVEVTPHISDMDDESKSTSRSGVQSQSGYHNQLADESGAELPWFSKLPEPESPSESCLPMMLNISISVCRTSGSDMPCKSERMTETISEPQGSISLPASPEGPEQSTIRVEETACIGDLDETLDVGVIDPARPLDQRSQEDKQGKAVMPKRREEPLASEDESEDGLTMTPCRDPSSSVMEKSRQGRLRRGRPLRKRSRVLCVVEDEDDNIEQLKEVSRSKRSGVRRKGDLVSQLEEIKEREKGGRRKARSRKEDHKDGNKENTNRHRISAVSSRGVCTASTSDSDCGPTPRPPSPTTPICSRAEMLGMLIESMATSRASSLPVSSLCRSILQSRPNLVRQRSERHWLKEFERVLEEGWRECGVFGKVESSGKDDSGCSLEAQWFYVPERDEDQERATLIRSMMPRPAKRSETKKYKQYYYRPLEKMSRWDPEDEM